MPTLPTNKWLGEQAFLTLALTTPSSSQALQKNRFEIRKKKTINQVAKTYDS
ncbi:hypothetical protein [Paenibacillus sp. PvR053]